MSENQLRRIALGTVQFGMEYGISYKGERTPPEEVEAILDLAWERGMDTLDTAAGYGKSEEVLGRVRRGHFKIVSKFTSGTAEGDLEGALRETLSRLRLSSLYGYLAHDSRALLEHPEQWRDLQELREKGLVGRIGYSLYTPETLDALLEKGMVPDLVQLPYNIADRRFESRLPSLRERGVEIHTRSAFKQGIFFMNYDELPDYFEGFRPYFRLLESACPEAPDRASALLRFCLNNEYIDKVVIGVHDREQLRVNLEGALREDELPDFAALPMPDEDVLMPYNWPELE